MKWQNELTELLNLKYPIIQGPFGGGYSSVKLASTVSNEGGLGSFGAHHLTHDQILEIDSELKAATKFPYAINLWIKNDRFDYSYSDQDYEKTKALFKPFFDELDIALPEKPSTPKGGSNEEQFEAILKAKPPVFSFVFGIPDEAILKEMRSRNIKLIGAATSVEEAVLLEDAEIDAIVATGFEAGGHRVAFLENPEDNLMGLISLVPRVVDAVNTPVIAAGGIADGRGIAAVIALGAQGAQIGTAFLATEESNATTLHRDILFSPKAQKTILTKAFTGRLARGTESIISERTKSSFSDLAPYPLQGLFIAPLRKAAIEQGRTDLISFWSGQSAPLIKHRSAKELFNSLVKDVEAI